MGKKQIKGGKGMNTGVGKETHIGREGNAYRREGNTYTVGRKCIHALYKIYKFFNSLLLTVDCVPMLN